MRFLPLLGFALLSFCIPDFTYGQGTEIMLANSSFEDHPRAGAKLGRPHRGWFNCGPAAESVPDIQPSPDQDNLFFGVSTPALKGETYLGMVVRDNDTWEGLSQRLRAKPLEEGKEYYFSVALAKSPRYVSPSRYDDGITDHIEPCVFRIFGGKSYCGKAQLLVQSDLIDHTEWRIYNFRFRPDDTYNFFTLEAFYEQGTLMPYNGNLLVDNLRLFELSEGEVAKIPKAVKPRGKIKRNKNAPSFADIAVEESVETQESAFDPRKDIQNLEQLKSYVSARGEKCTFIYKIELLAFLEVLSEKMGEFPEEEIVIGISKEDFNRKGAFIRDAFRHYKLSDSRFRIVPLAKEGEAKWLAVNGDFAWRLDTPSSTD